MALETEAAFDLQKPVPIVDVVPPIPRSEEDEQRRHRYNDPSGARSGESSGQKVCFWKFS